MKDKLITLLLFFILDCYSIHAQLPNSTTLSEMINNTKNHVFKDGVQEIMSFNDLFDSTGILKVTIKEKISQIHFDESSCYKIYLDSKTEITADSQKYREMYNQLVSQFQELNYYNIEIIDCKKQWQPYLTLYYEAYKIGYKKMPPVNCIYIQIDVRDFKNNRCVPSEEYRMY